MSDALWKLFCNEFELTEFANDQSLDSNNDRVEQRDRIMPVVEALFKSMTADQLMQRLDRAGIPFAPINTPSDLFEDEHLSTSGGLVDVTLTDGDNKGETARLPALPLEVGGNKFALRHDLSSAGQHSHDVLSELGYSESEIANLKAAGSILSV